MVKVSRKNQRQMHIWLDRAVRDRLIRHTTKEGLIARMFIQNAIKEKLEREQQTVKQ